VNKVQHWAQSYAFWMRRRDELEDRDKMLESLTLYLAPENWMKFFKDKVLGQWSDPEGAPVTDVAEMDQYFAEQERKWKDDRRLQQVLNGTHTVSGASAVGQEWGPWQ